MPVWRFTPSPTPSCHSSWLSLLLSPESSFQHWEDTVPRFLSFHQAWILFFLDSRQVFLLYQFCWGSCCIQKKLRRDPQSLGIWQGAGAVGRRLWAPHNVSRAVSRAVQIRTVWSRAEVWRIFLITSFAINVFVKSAPLYFEDTVVVKNIDW